MLSRSHRLSPLALAAALPLALCPPSLAAAEERAPTPGFGMSRALAEAEASLAQGEIEIAESRYRTALLEGWLLLGALQASRGELPAARSSFERASTSAVETRRPHITLALTLLELGEAREAILLLRRVVGATPGDLVARRLMARALMEAGQVDEAVQELVELQALAPEDLENTYLLARAHLVRGRPDAAEPLFARLAEARPIPETHVLIGRTYRDFESYELARRSLESALAMDPGVRRAHYYLGTVDLFDRGQALLDRAMDHFRQELRAYPDDPLTNLYVGMALVEERRHEEALPHLEIAGREGSSRTDALQFLGRALLALDRPEEAAAALRRGLELAASEAPESAARGPLDRGERQLSSLHYQLGLALRRLGDEAAAAEHFEAAKRSASRSTESSREILARYLEDAPRERSPTPFGSPLAALLPGEPSPAEMQKIAAAVRRGLTQAYFNLGVLRTRSRQFARAAELFASAAEIDPEFPRVQYSLGVAHFNAGEFEEATAPLSRALATDPGDGALKRMLALARLNSEDYEEAVRLLADDAEREVNPSLQYAYGLALVRSGRAAEAQAIFDRLLTEHAAWPELHVVLGQSHAQQNDYEAAVRFLRRAIELKTNVAEAHGTLGDIYLRQGKLEEAEEALRTELRHHPQDARARYTLAAVLDLNRKPDEALELLRALLEAHPQMADGRYLLGKILLARGALEEAREQLEAAAGLSPEDANIRYQLGQAYQKLGQSERAEREFETFRRLKKGEREGAGP